MKCTSVGSANADVGGIEIVVAFAFQAIASFLLSLWSALFLVDERFPEVALVSDYFEVVVGRLTGITLRADSKLRKAKRTAVARLLVWCSDTQITIGMIY